MRFATFIIAGALAVFANAQDDATTTGTTTATPVASLTPAQSSAAACLAACDAGDVNCTAKCIAVPNPSGSQVNATNQCVANCDQGNGTAAANTEYSNCVQDCINENYFTDTGTPAATGASGVGDAESTATATGTATGTAASGTASKTGTASSSSASSTSTNAADAIRVGATGLSLLAMLAGAMAL